VSYYGQGDYYHTGDRSNLYSADSYEYMGDPGFWSSIGSFFKTIAKPVLSGVASLIPGVGGLVSGLVNQFMPDPAQLPAAASAPFSAMNAGGGILNHGTARSMEAEQQDTPGAYDAGGLDETQYDEYDDEEG